MDNFRAFRIHADKIGTSAGIETLSLDDLVAGEVVIEGHYSSVNYKDALAGTGKGRILRQSPLVGGIDMSGRVLSSEDSRFAEGDPVVVAGCDLSETRDGGYSEVVRATADTVVRVPEGLSLRQAAALGTAGYTAGIAVQRMEENHQTPALGPVVVTGATGGVGSIAIDMLAGLGYEVCALTGKPREADYLKSLGATQILNRLELDTGSRPLEKAQWGGAVENLGGEILTWLTRTVRPMGNIASIGLAASAELNTTVMPFILRGINLLGINSQVCPRELRCKVWERMATDLRPRQLDNIVTETISLEQLPDAFERVIASKIHGRILVDLRP